MKNHANVNITLIDSSIGTRDSVRHILQNNGFRSISTGTTFDDLERSCQPPIADLIITTLHLDDGNVCELIKKLRHSEIGNNPFVPVIALVTDPIPELVRDAVDAGVDHLVTVPVSTKQFLDRIDQLINRRKQFVVTSDYIGPDRRKDQSRETTVPLIDAPNTLKARVTGDTALLQKAIDDCMAEVNLQKLERHAFQMMWLVERIVDGMINPDSGHKDDVDDHIDRLHYISQDTARRLDGTKYAHVSDLCQSLIAMSETLQSHNNPIITQEFKLLLPITKAIQLGFKSGVAATAQEIIAVVEGRTANA